MAGNRARLRHGRETQTTLARREWASQLASTQRRGRVRAPVQMDESGSSSRSMSRVAQVSSFHQEVREDEEEVIPDVNPSHGEEEEEHGYPGGPRDTSLFIYYHDHVARRVWEGQDRLTIKSVNHAWKIFDLFKPDDQWFNDVVSGSGLDGLCMTGWGDDDHLARCSLSAPPVDQREAAAPFPNIEG
ncbi:uncharacterized protein LOC131605181 [Vicia villosa]|uniref:uncharacterized protein LOC131605181 n=1 Tax=Vicia villosa TaxID=3911 RepID=UPI00273BB29E|nr:uncharacterized protein LOC131605181 [Vicia villosa]